MLNRRSRMLTLVVAALSSACGLEPLETDWTRLRSDRSAADLYVFRSPYDWVDWDRDLRLVAQVHDHVGVDTTRIRAYDDAGYDLLVLLDYSGVRSLPYAQTRRLWPPEDFLTPEFVGSLKSIRTFLPGAEEVGFDHVVSGFLTEYIEAREPAGLAYPFSMRYSSTQEALDLIKRSRALGYLAHPWGQREHYQHFVNVSGVEVYSAYAAVMEGRREFSLMQGNPDPNRGMRAVWEDRLTWQEGTWGIAVNDHFGPDDRTLPIGDPLRDSGKIVVYAPSASLEDVRWAMESGAILAVEDRGQEKMRPPFIRGFRVTADSAVVDTDGAVRWISFGDVVGVGRGLSMADVPRGANYVRAEVDVAPGVTVYLQPLALRPVGDVDGDWGVDARDELLCATARRNGHTPTTARACAAWADPPPV